MLNNAELTEQFPYAHFHAEWNLMTWHPDGVLDNERADRVIDFLEMQEAAGAPPFNRFVDMAGYSRIRIDLNHVVRLVIRRKRGYHGPPVKSALYAVRLLTVGVAHMYQELMARSPILVGTFREKAAAANWLGVPESVLAAPQRTIA